ncbi:ATP-dependent helicase HrpA [Lonsdalea britannica]|uniref:ATP-dependent helicase HrpA n=1 Tax=Lonsdalea britannica TaxID=1082704 RepID=A0AAD0SJE6_9GAMM|nr:ATP-dependent helicase HrpA [Lonsdalea britannica]AXW88859.1 ATP-dependent helicase HrpA [Lonsdalea britannica]OSM96022.1 ATP-dependent helicase HrpA [Lonsdalea britannica]OSN03138.1 ATP-dependent helicase HrpA [Lonsdalea britannica]
MFGLSNAASLASMQTLDKTMAETTAMTTAAQSQKMKTDAMNSITDMQMDSASKAMNASTKTAKSIQF